MHLSLLDTVIICYSPVLNCQFLKAARDKKIFHKYDANGLRAATVYKIITP